MRKAFCMIRQEPHYRRDAFMAGLKAAGYDARTGAPQQGAGPGDVLVTWNRYGDVHELATRFERNGGVVLVAENGYVGPGGVSPHQMQPREWYALALGGHNGSGTWPVGDSLRWRALGVELKGWRSNEGTHILVLPNRSFGRPDLIMPLRWAEDVKARIGKITKRPVHIRAHPGNDPPKKPLAEDLRDAFACVVWSSSAGVHALIAGVPVYCECPKWICKGATLPPIGKQDLLLSPWAMDHTRLDAMIGMSWAQWQVDEIATGAPFAHLLQSEAAAA